MFARRGDATPPTKLHTFFFGVRIARVRIDPKHDIDLIPGYFHPLHQGPDEIPFACPVGFLQAPVDFRGKVFLPSTNQLQCGVEGRFLRELLLLLLQAGNTLARTSDPRLKLVLIDEPVRITVD